MTMGYLQQMLPQSENPVDDAVGKVACFPLAAPLAALFTAVDALFGGPSSSSASSETQQGGTEGCHCNCPDHQR
jgi:hypothetical protein